MILVSYCLYYTKPWEEIQLIFVDMDFTSAKHNYPETLMAEEYPVAELCQQHWC
jgi:hypothetical protein